MPKPSEWGPSMWKSMHWIAAQYPLAPTLEDEEKYAQYFELLAFVLPCPTCKFHYSKLLRDDPVRKCMGSREELSEWVWRAHNRVNVRTGKMPIMYLFVTQNYGVGKPMNRFIQQSPTPKPKEPRFRSFVSETKTVSSLCKLGK